MDREVRDRERSEPRDRERSEPRDRERSEPRDRERSKLETLKISDLIAVCENSKLDSIVLPQ